MHGLCIIAFTDGEGHIYTKTIETINISLFIIHCMKHMHGSLVRLVRLVMRRSGGGRGLVTGLGHRHLRGRVLGGHGRRQVGTLRLVAVVVGGVGDGVGVAVVVGVAVLALDSVAGVATIASHGLARRGGRDAVLSLVAEDRTFGKK